jgi:hypothetical protein
MKSLLALLVLFTMIGCSSDKDDKSPEFTPFQKASNGDWLSECQQDNEGFYKETLSLKGSSGTTSNQYFQNNDCSGATLKTDAPTAFTYSSVNKAGGKEGEATISITVPGQPPVKVEVVVQGNTMSVTGPTGTTLYTRIGSNDRIGKGQTTLPDTPANKFDTLAQGRWSARDCVPLEGNRSYLQILTVRGGGSAQQVYNVFNTPNCRGNLIPQQESELEYAVLNFEGNSGQLSINGQTINVSIQGNQMTVSGPEGSTVFIKVR